MHQRRVSAWSLLWVLASVTACSGNPTPSDGGELTWWVEAQKAASSSPVYFIASAGSTTAAWAVYPADQSQLACSDLTMAPDAGDQWYLEIALGVPTNGTTINVGGDTVGTGSAVVAVYHREPTQSVGWSAYAVSGQLDLSSFPADATAITTPFAGHLAALFPDDPVSTIDCQGGGQALPDGGFEAMAGVCACQKADGGTFTCDLPVSTTQLPSCCYGDGGATTQNHQLSFDFNASGCSGS